jgi:toxin HigB-1
METRLACPVMEVEFARDDLVRLEVDPSFTAGLPPDVVKAYRKRMQMIRAALDERDFYALKSLHFEKLSGNRAGDRSMRLNGQYRLILQLTDKSAKTVKILGVEDYH